MQNQRKQQLILLKLKKKSYEKISLMDWKKIVKISHWNSRLIVTAGAMNQRKGSFSGLIFMEFQSQNIFSQCYKV